MQKHPTAVRDGQASMTAAVTGVLDRMPSRSHAVKRLDEFLLAQGALARLYFETVIAQRLRRIRVNVFQ